LLHLWPIRFHIYACDLLDSTCGHCRHLSALILLQRDLRRSLSKWYDNVWDAIIVTLHDMNVYLEVVWKLLMTIVCIYEYWRPIRFSYYRMYCRLTITRRVSLVEQNLQEHLRSPRSFYWGSCCSMFNLSVLLYNWCEIISLNVFHPSLIVDYICIFNNTYLKTKMSTLILCHHSQVRK
jgi:hypothetical protein